MSFKSEESQTKVVPLPLPDHLKSLVPENYSRFSDGSWAEDDEEVPITEVCSPSSRSRRLSGGSDVGCPQGCDDEYAALTLEELVAMPKLRAINRLISTGSVSKNPTIKEFWRNYTPFVDDCIRERAMDIINAIIMHKTRGVGALEILIEGVLLGAKSARSMDSKETAESLSLALDSVTVLCEKITDGQVAHQSQTAQFAEQVTHASAAIASSVKQVEDLHLNLMKFETAPYAPASSFKPLATAASCGASCIPSSRSDLEPSTSMSRDTDDSGQIPVKFLDSDGVYSNSYLSIVVDHGKVRSVIPTGSAFQQLKIFTGANSLSLYAVVNKDLEALSDFELQHPGWLRGLAENPGREERDKMLEAIRHIRTKTYQWYRHSK